MIALAGVAIHSKIYESSTSLVYRGWSEQDNRAHCFADTARVVVKLLKQDYPSPQELTRYRQEYEIMRSLDLEGVVKAYSQQDYQCTLAILLEALVLFLDDLQWMGSATLKLIELLLLDE